MWPTEYLPSGNFHVPEEVLESLPSIRPENVTEAVIFVLSTPPHVQVSVDLQSFLQISDNFQ